MYKIILFLITFPLFAEEFVVFQHDGKYIKFIKTKNYYISANSNKDSMAMDAISKIRTININKNQIDLGKDFGATICQKTLKENLIFMKNKFDEVVPVCKFMDNSMIDTNGIQNIYRQKTSL